MRIPGFFCKFLWFSGLTAFALSLGLSYGEPEKLQDCSKAWDTLIPENLHHYGFKKDVRKTEFGNEGYESYAKRVLRKKCKKDWTVLVYMAADNDLSLYSYLDLYEMQAGYESESHLAASTLKSDWLVQWDTLANSGIRRLHLFQNPEPYNKNIQEDYFKNMKETDIVSPIVKIFKEEDGIRESAKLKNFLKWGIENYPAHHYMVVIWGHGQGWTSIKSEPSPVADDGASPFEGRKFGGLAFDDTSDTYLDIPSLVRVLKDVSKEKLNNEPFDVYASDACLMQMVEVAYELAPVARNIVGSTVIQNFLGLPYRRLMYHLNSGRFDGQHAQMIHELEAVGAGAPTKDIKGFEPLWLAKMIPDLFLDSMDPTRGLQGRMAKNGRLSVSMSALASDALIKELAPAMNQFGKQLKEILLESEVWLGIIYQEFIANETLMGGAKDFGFFLYQLELAIASIQRSLVIPEEAGSLEFQVFQQKMDKLKLMQKSIIQLKAVIQTTTLSKILGTDYSKKYHEVYSGLSVWVPNSQRAYNARFKDFQKSKLFRTYPDWGSWLGVMFPDIL